MRFSLTIAGTPMDQFADESVQLTRQVKDLTDLGRVYMDFTQEFELPSTPTNDKIFYSYFEENIYLSSWNPYQKLEAIIYVHSMPVFEGVVELVGVSYTDGLPRSYRVIFYGDTKNALTTWGEKTLADLDWSAYDHVVNETNVTASWSGGLLSGDVLYPVADWHAGWAYSTQFAVQKNIAKSTGGFALNDLRPAIRLKAMVETCFQDFGGVGGTLLSLSEIQSIYIAPMQAQGPIVNPTNNDAQITAVNGLLNVAASTMYSGPTNVPMTLSGADPLGTWNNTTSRYTVPFTGQYQFKFSCNVTNIPPYGTGNGVNFIFSRNKQSYVTGAQITTVGAYERIERFTLTKGDTIEVRYISGGAFDAASLAFEVEEVPQAITGSTLSLSDVMPTTKISDFVNGVLKAFNGVVIPDGSGGFEIHNLDDWYDAGVTKNWTEFIDINTIVHEKTPVPTELSMKHQEGKDMAGVSFKTAFTRDYGALNFKPDIDFGAAPFEIETPFNITLPSRLREVNDKGMVLRVTNHQMPVMLDKEGKAIQQAFTMFYYVGLKTTNAPYYLDGILRTQYPLISPYSDFPTTVSTYSLCYGMETTIQGNMPTNTMYQRYFSRSLSRLFSSMSRIVTMNAILPVGEWLNFKLNDTVAISSNYYKVQSITYDMLTQRAQLKLMSYPDVDILQLGATGNKPVWTNATAGPNGTTVLSGDVVGRDVVNAWSFGGVDYAGGGVNILDYNQTYALDYRAMIPNLIDRSYKTMLMYYNSATQGIFLPSDGSFQTVVLNTPYNMGNNDRLTFDMGTNGIQDVDGGQFRATAQLSIDHSGNIDLTAAILLNGQMTPLYSRITSDKGAIFFTGLIEVSGGQQLQLAIRSNGGSHAIDVIDAKLTLELC
jgi:hypothetical protein